MKRVQVITTASGNGGTTFAKELAARLDLPFHELDALFWKPGWTESTADELRGRVAPIVASNTWVIDGSYYSKLGDLVLRHADVVVWLDLPMRVWLPRLVHRTFRRAMTKESLWGTNRESIRNALLSRNSLLVFVLRNHRRTRRRHLLRLAGRDVVRLRSSAEVRRFLDATRRRAAK